MKRTVRIESAGVEDGVHLTRVFINDVDVSEMVNRVEFRQDRPHLQPFIQFTAIAEYLDRLPLPNIKGGERGSIVAVKNPQGIPPLVEVTFEGV